MGWEGKKRGGGLKKYITIEDGNGAAPPRACANARGEILNREKRPNACSMAASRVCRRSGARASASRDQEERVARSRDAVSSSRDIAFATDPSSPSSSSERVSSLRAGEASGDSWGREGGVNKYIQTNT